MRPSLGATPILVVVAALIAASVLAPPPAAAQCLCSGRCYQDPVTGQAYCGFSSFTCHECLEGQDFCWETACYGAPPPQSLNSPRGAGLLQVAPARECALKPQAPPAMATERSRVVVLKART
jgi:hypothetical protein